MLSPDACPESAAQSYSETFSAESKGTSSPQFGNGTHPRRCSRGSTPFSLIVLSCCDHWYTSKSYGLFVWPPKVQQTQRKQRAPHKYVATVLWIRTFPGKSNTGRHFPATYSSLGPSRPAPRSHLWPPEESLCRWNRWSRTRSEPRPISSTDSPPMLPARNDARTPRWTPSAGPGKLRCCRTISGERPCRLGTWKRLSLNIPTTFFFKKKRLTQKTEHRQSLLLDLWQKRNPKSDTLSFWILVIKKSRF